MDPSKLQESVGRYMGAIKMAVWWHVGVNVAWSSLGDGCNVDVCVPRWSLQCGGFGFVAHLNWTVTSCLILVGACPNYIFGASVPTPYSSPASYLYLYPPLPSSGPLP